MVLFVPVRNSLLHPFSIKEDFITQVEHWSQSSSLVVVSFHVILCFADCRLCFFDRCPHPFCHKLHSAISPPILRRFSRSQRLWKALEKTFRSIPVTPRSDQYWPRYQADQLVTTMVLFIKSPISRKLPQLMIWF